MINIGIVGCGNWSDIIIKEINKNRKFNLTSIVCRKKKYNQKKIKVFKTIDSMINSNLNDCIYVAALPETNLEVVKIAKEKNIHLILEKPISNSTKNFNELTKIANANKLIIYPNLTNYFSETFNELKKRLKNNNSKIKQIIIYEGNFGPFREKIHPIWDWGFHSISLLYLIFTDKEFTNITSKEIKSSNIYGKGIVTKFSFNIDKDIKVKIVTGNLFKKKIRKMKIIFEDKTYIENDMVLHKINLKQFNNFQNLKSPIRNLLDNFKKDILSKKYEKSMTLIEASSKTIKFLENFYK